jgi:hypothetical protein
MPLLNSSMLMQLLNIGEILLLSSKMNKAIFFSDHSEKANISWHAFKERSGTSDFISIQYDMTSHFVDQLDLSSLVQPFSKQEIDAVVKNLPSNKAPGPDGFNTDFIKHCWQIISSYFYLICDAFYAGSLCLQSISSSHITLVPKKG